MKFDVTTAPRIRRASLAALSLAAASALCGCQEESHSAQWYMGHGTELQAKLTECKQYPTLNTSDQNCKNANEAWATLVSASKPKATEVPAQP